MGAGTVMTCWAFLTADEYLYWPLLVPAGMSVRPPTVWVPMLSVIRHRSSSDTTFLFNSNFVLFFYTVKELTCLLCRVNNMWCLGGGLSDCSDGGRSTSGTRTAGVLGCVGALKTWEMTFKHSEYKHIYVNRKQWCGHPEVWVTVPSNVVLVSCCWQCRGCRRSELEAAK